MLKFVCLAVLFAVAAANEVKFTDCGHNEVAKLDVSGCSGDFCVIHKGKPLKLVADFVANQDSKTVEIKITGKVNSLEVPFPGVESNGCNHVKCPLVKGQKYTFSYDLNIPTILPTIKSSVTAKLVGEQGLIGCVTINGEVKD